MKQALRKPDNSEDTHGGRIKVSKDVGEKTIEVIYCKENFKDKGEEYLIVTAYYL